MHIMQSIKIKNKDVSVVEIIDLMAIEVITGIIKVKNIIEKNTESKILILEETYKIHTSIVFNSVINKFRLTNWLIQ